MVKDSHHTGRIYGIVRTESHLVPIFPWIQLLQNCTIFVSPKRNVFPADPSVLFPFFQIMQANKEHSREPDKQATLHNLINHRISKKSIAKCICTKSYKRLTPDIDISQRHNIKQQYQPIQRIYDPYCIIFLCDQCQKFAQQICNRTGQRIKTIT